jgi:hypothetical protein
LNYALLSLVGDDATRMNDEFARWFKKDHPPACAFHDEHPSHDEVAAQVQAASAALVMSHDGNGTLRAVSRGRAWATGAEFGRMFSGKRVWVYACDTRSEHPDLDLASFGRAARAHGVAVFAGHVSPITAPPTYDGMVRGLREHTYRMLARAFRHFLLGSNDADEIRLHARRSRARSNLLGALGIEDALDSLVILK